MKINPGRKRILEIITMGKLLLRTEPMELSAVEVKKVIKVHGFYDKIKNPQGKGSGHQYKLQQLKGEKVVVDEISNLMWQQSGSSGCVEYDSAKKWIEKFNREGCAGYNDWRIPTLEEAMSLIEQEKKSNSLYINPIFDKKQDWIWTSDILTDKAQAWVVNFYLGGCYHIDFFENKYVRAVRSL